jgi:uncharacterized membrane protein
MQDLGTLPGDTNSEAFGINSRAEVVGHSSGLRGTRAFLWRRGGEWRASVPCQVAITAGRFRSTIAARWWELPRAL